MPDDFTYLTKGKIYTVTDIDNSNNNIDILMMRVILIHILFGILNQ